MRHLIHCLVVIEMRVSVSINSSMWVSLFPLIVGCFPLASIFTQQYWNLSDIYVSWKCISNAVFLYMMAMKVVFFGDNVPKDRADKSVAAAKECDAFLVLGSSVMTMSAYRLVRCIPCFLCIFHKWDKSLKIFNQHSKLNKYNWTPCTDNILFYSPLNLFC